MRWALPPVAAAGSSAAELVMLRVSVAVSMTLSTNTNGQECHRAALYTLEQKPDDGPAGGSTAQRRISTFGIGNARPNLGVCTSSYETADSPTSESNSSPTLGRASTVSIRLPSRRHRHPPLAFPTSVRLRPFLVPFVSSRASRSGRGRRRRKDPMDPTTDLHRSFFSSRRVQIAEWPPT